MFTPVHRVALLSESRIVFYITNLISGISMSDLAKNKLILLIT